MNTPDFDTSSHRADHAGFDARTREAHAAACAAVSPRVRAQLQQRRRAARMGTRASAGPRWVPAVAMAATLALAVGLGLHLLQPQTDDTGAAGPAVVAQGAAPGVSSASSASGTLETSDTSSATSAIAAAARPAGTAPHAAPTQASSLDADLDAIAALLATDTTGEHPDRAGMTASQTGGDAALQDDALLAALEESPDFYLWLGADDGADVEAL